jgi:hypothetical protein
MTILLPNIGNAEIRDVWVQGFMAEPQNYPLFQTVFNPDSDDKNALTVLSTPDLPLLNPRASKVAPIEDTIIVDSFQKVFTHQERARKIGIPYADLRDRPEILTKYAKVLGIRTIQTIEALLCAVVANGFAATLTARLEPVFSANHVQLDGGPNQSNRLTAGLSHTNFATAAAMMLFQRTDYGGVCTYPIANLLVSKENVELGKQIKAASYTDSNLQPTSYQGTFNVVPIMFTSDTNDWFVLSSRGLHSFTYVLREAPDFWSKWVEDDMRWLEYAYFRMSQGVIDYRGSVGSEV